MASLPDDPITSRPQRASVLSALVRFHRRVVLGPDMAQRRVSTPRTTESRLAGLGMAHMRLEEWFDQFRSATGRVHPYAGAG